MMENTKEYFCWLRVVPAVGGGTPAAPAPAEGSPVVPSNMTTEEATAYLRLSCPEVSWLEEPRLKRPPAPPVKSTAVGPFEKRARSVLDLEPMTTVHMERMKAPVEFNIEMQPVFGDRMDAFEWLESPAGMLFSKDVQGMTLICFTVVDRR